MKSFQELGKALKELRRDQEQTTFAELLRRAEAGDVAALRELHSVEPDRIPQDRRKSLAAAFYLNGKAEIADLKFDEAIVSFRRARDLDPGVWLYRERLRLAADALRPSSLEWRASLIQLKADLHMPCPRDPCECTTHFEIANCRHALEAEYESESFIAGPPLGDGVTTYTVGHYFSRTRRTRWTRWLKAVKHDCRFELLKPLADITADFVVEKTPLLKEADVLVSVPSDPNKFAQRGFAATDSIATRLAARLALPYRDALVRDQGGTRTSSYEQLSEQFSVDRRELRSIQSLTLLLVEDIWTWGRTIPICAAKLREAGAKEVFAVALGQSTF